VRSIQTAYAIATPTVTLEHIINTLRDRILFGEVNAETISGNRTCTGEEAARYILDRQGDWRLGTFGFNVSSPYDFSGDTLYAALERVTQTCDDAMWTFDMSSYPFTLNIIPKPSGIGSEMRLNRNITAITRTIDRSSMYTRFYPIGKDDLHISEEYVSRNEGTYGVISKVEVDTTLESEDELRAWANERLRKHADPEVTVEVEGLELADATGESLDRIRLGRICRIPMPEFGTTIEERVTGLDYEDKVHSPELVTVTLSNQSADVARNVLDVIAESIMEGSGPSGSGRGGGGGRGGAQQAKEDHAWFEDTDEHVAMVAEGIIGRDANGNPNWYRLSQIVVDGQGIHQSVEEIKGENVIRDTKIEQNEQAITMEANERIAGEASMNAKITVQADRITSEVSNRLSAESQLSSRITQTATAITAEVNARVNADTALSSRITVNAAGIETKVSKNGVISAINQTAESVTIQASKINLSGYVTASQLNSTNARIDNIISGDTTINKAIIGALYANTTMTCLGHGTYWQAVTIGGTNYHFLGYVG
jgi:phage minor structural protein